MGWDRPISMYGGHIALLNEIKGTTNSDVEFSWDAALLNDLCEDILVLWESDKWRLKAKEQSSGFSLKEELKGRIKELESVISGVVAQNLNIVNDTNRNELAKMVNELEEYGIPSLRAKVSLSGLLDISVDLEREIPYRIGSPDESVVNDCLKTIAFIGKEGKDVMRWVVLLSEYFRSFSTQGKDCYSSWMDYFTENPKYIESELIRENLIIGLGRLFHETRISISDSELDANDKMNQRMLVAPIVRRLVERDGASGNVILRNCQSYYESENTCWDVKNKYYE